MALAVFVLGGAASGKTAVIRDRYVGTVDLYPQGDTKAHPPHDGFSHERRYDADAYKLLNPMYTPACGDAQSVKRFGATNLGGPSGPKDIQEFERYPPEVRAAVEQIIADLGFSSLEEFASTVVMDPDTVQVAALSFGGGLTHEISKFVAAAAFEEQLEKGPEGGSVVWDATGNTERYAYWIEMALERGFDVEIVYVTCPLAVALMRAANRERELTATEVRRTHAKAARTANDLEIMAGDHPDSERMTFEEVATSSAGEEAEASDGGYGEPSAQRRAGT